MFLNVRVDNFLVYSNEVELSLVADMRIKKFADNVHMQHGFNILKSACIYGANNSGKTCLVRAINSIKNVLLGYVAEVPSNIFRDDKVCSFGVTFMERGRVFDYDFKYDSTLSDGYKRGFVYECLRESTIDQHKNISSKELFIRDVAHGIYRFHEDEELSKVLSLVSNDNILIYTLNAVRYSKIGEYKEILRQFADSITLLDMNNIPINRTIEVLKNNEKIKAKTVELIRLADLDIEDFLYYKEGSDLTTLGLSNEAGSPDPREAVLRQSVAIDDMFRLTSVHRGKSVQSFSFDSTGTKKIVSIASYIVEALEMGKTLVVDELDSSLHFKLTRAIVALFNNELNVGAQLIFTAHDATLLDCKKLFRKDQIWFASKDSANEYLYSLAEFTAKENKIRSETDLFDRYNSGVLGALPEPDMISILLKNTSDNGEE